MKYRVQSDVGRFLCESEQRGYESLEFKWHKWPKSWKSRQAAHQAAKRFNSRFPLIKLKVVKV